MKIIPLFPNGSSRFSITLRETRVVIITRYNYQASCWTICLHEADDTPILCGVMLVPGIDLLRPYRQVKEFLGSLVLVEKGIGDYTDPNYLGVKTLLLWFDVGEEIVVPS